MECDFPNGHRAFEIQLRGKPDSVYVTCACGEVEAIGSWFHRPPPGWDEEGWPSLMGSIVSFLTYDATITPGDE